MFGLSCNKKCHFWARSMENHVQRDAALANFLIRALQGQQLIDDYKTTPIQIHSVHRHRQTAISLKQQKVGIFKKRLLIKSLQSTVHIVYHPEGNVFSEQKWSYSFYCV